MLAAALLLGLEACNDCHFVERCRGNVRQLCGGIDQVVGRRLHEEPCLDPNGACVEDGRRAYCVASPVARCGADHVPRCDGERLLGCIGGFVTVTDCAGVRMPDGSPAGLTCRPGDLGRAQCLPR
jgi:hypothetical protein